jgi:hypothetical protein
MFSVSQPMVLLLIWESNYSLKFCLQLMRHSAG